MAVPAYLDQHMVVAVDQLALLGRRWNDLVNVHTAPVVRVGVRAALVGVAAAKEVAVCALGSLWITMHFNTGQAMSVCVCGGGGYHVSTLAVVL